MQATLSFHFGFVTAPIAAAVIGLILLHCDKLLGSDTLKPHGLDFLFTL
jgi:hypothetical protein